MNENTDTDDHHEWWEFFYDFNTEVHGEKEETPEQAMKRIQREREEAYDRAMDII